MRIDVRLLAWAQALAIAWLSDAQPASECSGLTVSTYPAALTAGRLLLVRLASVPLGAQLGGTLAGETLHFAPTPTGAESLASMAIDSIGTRRLVITCAQQGRIDSVTTTVRVQAGAFGVDRLRVNPAFTRKPDSALAARIADESRRALAVARESHATPRLWESPFRFPRDARVTSGFGRAREFNGEVTSRHLGTDFAGRPGEPVVAVNRGVVRLADAFYYGGNVVYVDHGDGLTTAYLHLSRAAVAPGDTVIPGQLVGLVGSSGRVTGPHLHLIVRHGAVSVDPMSLYELMGDSTARDAVAAARAPSERPAGSRGRRSAPPARGSVTGITIGLADSRAPRVTADIKDGPPPRRPSSHEQDAYPSPRDRRGKLRTFSRSTRRHATSASQVAGQAGHQTGRVARGGGAPHEREDVDPRQGSRRGG